MICIKYVYKQPPGTGVSIAVENKCLKNRAAFHTVRLHSMYDGIKKKNPAG